MLSENLMFSLVGFITVLIMHLSNYLLSTSHGIHKSFLTTVHILNKLKALNSSIISLEKCLFSSLAHFLIFETCGLIGN